MICQHCHIIYEDSIQVCAECKRRLVDPLSSQPHNDRFKASPSKGEKQESFDWEGHQIVIRAVLPAKYLWMATQNQLWIDGKLAASSGGMNFSSQAECTIEHNGGKVRVTLQTRTRLSLSGGGEYDFRINNVSYRKGQLRSEISWLVPDGLG